MKEEIHAAGYISRLGNKMRREMDTRSFKGIYSGAEGRTLHYILAHADEDIIQRDIEEEFCLRPPTASQLLKKMEDHGMIVREPMENDARYKRIRPSEKALEYRQDVLDNVESLEEKLRQGVDDRDLEVWAKVMAKMIENL